MKSNHLRIGNYVNTKQGIKLITTLSVDGWCMSHESKPIFLTEQWLLDLGFIKSEINKWYQISNFKIEIIIDSENEINLCVVNDMVLRDIIFVHQLQNLYFALAGRELKIK